MGIVRWERMSHAATWLLLAGVVVTAGCGPDAPDQAESQPEPAGDPAATPASDSLAAAVDLTALPGYEESRARIERAKAEARRHPLSEWDDHMAVKDDTPVERAPVARAVSLTLLSLPHDGVYIIARASMDDRDAWELSVNLVNDGLDFVRIHRDPWAVLPLIEGLGSGGGPPAFEDHWFRLTQMALVAITGNSDAPRYPRTRPEGRRRTAQEYWAGWWEDNAAGFTPAHPGTARNAVHWWMQKREP